MRPNSKLKQQYPQTVKNRFENHLLNQHRQHRYLSHAQSPYSSKNNFCKVSYSQLQHSQPQFIKKLPSNMVNLRDKKALIISDALKSQSFPQIKQHQNHNSSYIADINCVQRKKRARYTFLRKKEEHDEIYKIGILTKNGIQQQNHPHNKASQSTQPAITTNTNNPTPVQVGVEQIHYNMVLNHQKCKKLINL